RRRSIFSSPNKSCVSCCQSSIFTTDYTDLHRFLSIINCQSSILLEPFIEPFAYLLVVLRLVVTTQVGEGYRILRLAQLVGIEYYQAVICKVLADLCR